LFNHSCIPNVVYIAFGNEIVFIVSYPIKAGEQLFVPYCPTYEVLDREERQSALKDLNIKCDCKACKKNFPTFNCMTSKNLMKDFNMEDLKNMPTDVPVPSAIEQFKINCDILQKNWEHHPCLEIWLADFLFIHSLAEIAKIRL
jgi:hypothetical protein